MIEASGLTRRYGGRTVVDDLSFTVRPGTVTGFLGPNGAGKSTTMRLILGLDSPTRGLATVNGRRYADHPAPLREVGALLEARSVHPRRSAFRHLTALAYTHGAPRRRVGEVLGLAGLSEVAHQRAGGFSLGMGQRLGIASALLRPRRGRPRRAGQRARPGGRAVDPRSSEVSGGPRHRGPPPPVSRRGS